MGNAWTVIPAIGNVLMTSNSYKFSNFQYAYLGFALLGSAIIFSWMTGILGHKIGTKKVILISLLFFCCASCLFTIANFRTGNEVYRLLLFAQGLLGIAISGLLTSFSTYIVLLIPKKAPMVLTGVFFCVNFGSFCFPLMFNLISSDQFWWRITIVHAVMMFFLIGLGWKFLPDIRNVNSAPRQTFHEFSRQLTQRFWIFLTVIVIYSITENTFSSWITIFLHTVKDLSISKANIGLSSFWGTVALGQASVCILVRWISPKLIYRILPLFLILGYFGIYFSTNYNESVFFFIISALGCSAFFALSMSFVEGEYRSISEIASGIMVTGYFLGSALGASLFGAILESNVINLKELIFLVGFIPVVIAVLNNFLMSRKTVY